MRTYDRVSTYLPSLLLDPDLYYDHGDTSQADKTSFLGQQICTPEAIFAVKIQLYGQAYGSSNAFQEWLSRVEPPPAKYHGVPGLRQVLSAGVLTFDLAPERGLRPVQSPTKKPQARNDMSCE